MQPATRVPQRTCRSLRRLSFESLSLESLCQGAATDGLAQCRGQIAGPSGLGLQRGSRVGLRIGPSDVCRNDSCKNDVCRNNDVCGNNVCWDYAGDGGDEAGRRTGCDGSNTVSGEAADGEPASGAPLSY